MAMSSRVTVLLPVYNAELYIRESVNSILNQTFTDFELLIVDDGSTDQSPEILRSFKDSRIRLIQNESNQGLIRSLNRGLDLASSTYIARMDADDISLPQRLQTQVEFMDANPEIGLSSSWIKTFGKKNNIWKVPEKDNEIKARLFFNSCIWHPAAIIRKKVLDTYGLRYNPGYLRSEDYKLWLDIAEVSHLANIPEVLVLYRLHDNQEINRPNTTQKIREEMVSHLLGRHLSEKERKLHTYLFFKEPFKNRLIHEEIKKWASYLNSKNKQKSLYDKYAFEKSLHKILKKTTRKSFYFSISNLKRYHPGVLAHLFSKNPGYSMGFDTPELLKIVAKSLLYWPNRWNS